MLEPRVSRSSATLPVATACVSVLTSVSVRIGGVVMTVEHLSVKSEPMRTEGKMIYFSSPTALDATWTTGTVLVQISVPVNQVTTAPIAPRLAHARMAYAMMVTEP